MAFLKSGHIYTYINIYIHIIGVMMGYAVKLIEDVNVVLLQACGLHGKP